MQKLAGILDPIQDTLPPDVWGPDRKLLPEVRQAILNRIRQKFSMDKIREIIIIGSITGYKYDETSDIDVNVGLELPKDSNMKLKTKAVKDINNIPAPNSRHPINFFVQRWYPEMEQGYEDIAFGAYDVLEDRWLAPPPDKSKLRDPKVQFLSETRVARHLARAFNKKAEQYKQHIAKVKAAETPEQASKIQSSAIRILRDLAEIVNSVEDGRKFAYNYG